ncbi:FAD/NAD(P)-binding protein [Parapedobacter deserti]|uniref:FAD/NAD(P)-binding protein n=1 Tax=Parapedobacter deserti TaxID=1912957 RepID=A0ABV7JP50_9SPHI
MGTQYKTTIAIVGAGASGVACLIQLVIKHIVSAKIDPISIILFEKRNEFGPGLAYGTGQEGHLLNTRAGLMGIFPDEPLHFVQWMQSHQQSLGNRLDQHIHPNAYPPRMRYGEYVQAMLNYYQQEAGRHGITVKKERAEIIDAEITGDQKVILVASGCNRYIADYVILATGNPRSNNFTHLENLHAYIPSPWPAGRILTTVTDKYARVGIVGSSLTAIDAMITLVENGHKGTISFFSLEGLLPRVQPPIEAPYERKILTLSNIRKLIRETQRPLRVKDLIRFLRAEAEQHLQQQVNWKAEERRGKDPLKLLTKDIQDALGGHSIVQRILYSLRYESYPIWKMLPADQKLLFGKWIKTDVDINWHAIPMENGIKLKQMLESGQLLVIGHSDDIEWNGNHFILKTNDGKSYRADFVINASGPATSLQQMDDLPLLQQLLKRGYIEEYGPGGLMADLNTMRILTQDVTSHSPFYAIGHPLIGLQHDVNALWFNVTQADKLTDDLIQRLSR